MDLDLEHRIEASPEEHCERVVDEVVGSHVKLPRVAVMWVEAGDGRVQESIVAEHDRLFIEHEVEGAFAQDLGNADKAFVSQNLTPEALVYRNVGYLEPHMLVALVAHVGRCAKSTAVALNHPAFYSCEATPV